ncbi:MAG: polysaccharide deacetylase family protein [Candidatus Omnitrophica bacterium]|nr:polysaccharide deacetylase family protein [Candidatus Omnitrophota bacterium]
MNKKIFLFSLAAIVYVAFLFAIVTVFFDQAILLRKHTFYRANVHGKVIALTFDDGPSNEWTPQILDALKEAKVKATFFALGEHVARYPEIARRVIREGHEIGNHSYNHHALIFYKTGELKKEIKDCEKAVQDATGITTRYFRPPKAWLNETEKKIINSMGYVVVLWSLNSKDWVTFDDRYIVRFIVKNVRPGDIILFHDSGGVFGVDGGDRNETVKTLPDLINKLQGMGYKFLTISELLQSNETHEGK